jgi:type IV pilus assembly protein PilB
VGVLLDYLKDSIDPGIYARALEEEKNDRGPGDFLLREGYFDSRMLTLAMSYAFDLPSIRLDKYEPQEEALLKVPEEVARRFKIVPLFILKNRLFAATATPNDLMVSDYIRQLTGMTVDEVVTTREDIEAAINRHYLASGRSARIMKEMTGRIGPEDEPELDSVRIEDKDAPSIKTANHIIASAIRLEASDIHLEPFMDSLYLRYRIDGVLHEFSPPPLDMARALVSRIKIISGMDIAERRLPQDGRSSFVVDDKSYDLRVSVIPNIYGESVVIRILDSTGAGRRLEELGFHPLILEDYARMISRPHGIILVTGPTGSGKSTTLYATLRHILTPEKKIITLEDPVEYQMKGITQLQMHPEIGFTFARGLRSVLRHDPDVIMVGEIRDLESAEIAIRSSLTGHLLFSTLHTNDAPSALSRLIDMGVQPFMVMASLVGVLAQRLIRKLCPACKTPFSPSPAQLSMAGLNEIPPGAEFYSPAGCTQCGNLGYKGRAGVHELLEITGEMRRLSPDRMTPDNFRKIAAGQGGSSFHSIKQSALDIWASGITSMEEVMKLTVE